MTTRAAILSFVCWVVCIDLLSAQSCTSLPLESKELWAAAGVLQKGGLNWKEWAFEASPGNRFGISFRRATNGTGENNPRRSWAARVGVPVELSVASLCAFGGFEMSDFSFVDRFEMDRGEGEYLAREIGLRADVPIASFGEVHLRAWMAPAMTRSKLEVRGRTLVLDGQVATEERHFVDMEWLFSGQGGLNLRWRSVGVAGGVERRPALSDGVLAFLRMGVGLSPGGH